MFLQGLVFVLLKSSIRRPHGADVDGTEALGPRRRSPLTVHLKPYWGKPAVRNFRGGRGNPKLGARRAPLPYSALTCRGGMVSVEGWCQTLFFVLTCRVEGWCQTLFFVLTCRLRNQKQSLTHCKMMGEFDYRNEVTVDVLGRIFERSITDIEDIKAKSLDQHAATRGSERGHPPSGTREPWVAPFASLSGPFHK